MKNFEGIWTCPLEQVNNPMRGEGSSTQLVCKNKWVRVGSQGQGMVLQSCDTEMSWPNVGCDAETSWLLCHGWKGSGSRLCGNQSGCWPLTVTVEICESHVLWNLGIKDPAQGTRCLSPWWASATGCWATVKMVSQSHVLQVESLRNMLLVEASLLLNCLRQIPGRFITHFTVGRCEFFRYQILCGIFVHAD